MGMDKVLAYKVCAFVYLNGLHLCSGMECCLRDF